MSWKIANNVLELIGSTPMVKLQRLTNNGAAEVVAKLEYFNPGGSVKDRIAYNMIEEAEKQELLKPGGTIVEATSGNTGIGLAMVAAAKEYKLILVMPETMSLERQNLLKAYGAQLYLTSGEDGMDGSIKKAMELVDSMDNCFMPSQFDNLANPAIHRRTTALEILQQTEGKIDAFVAGIGTGGTITGVAEVLRRELGKEVKIIGVEPKSSPVLTENKSGAHKIQGIGAGFVPKVLKRELIDEIIPVSDEDAYITAMHLARKEGLMVGISAGAAAFAAMEIATRLKKGKRVVVMLPDTGERYLSMAPYFKLDLRKKGLLDNE
ncbi:MAG: cysteine synthase A [Bacillota bacterium]|nr:cysteine synthase A [Bacillota bacterium]